MLGAKKLNIGCGKYPQRDAVNLDIIEMEGVDVVWDLNKRPYPFENGQFEEIIAKDILEHLDDILGVMEELWRILKAGGKLLIRVPLAKYPEKAWIDPTHKHVFTMESFDYWDDSTYYGREYGFYTKAKFCVVERKEHNFGGEFLLIKKEI